MANNVTELPVKNFDQLDPIDSVQNSDYLLIRTGDSYTKRATKINFMKDEVDARTAQDVVLQTHIDDLTSDLAGTTGLAKRDVPNGLASLDSNGLVPASQLPSYVDDVIEGYYNPADGKFYENYTPTVTHDIWTDGTSFLNADTTAGTRPAGMEKSVTLLGAARKHSNTFYNRVGDNWYEVTAFTSIGFTTSSTAVSTASIIKALNNATDINISYAQYEEGSYSGEITPETGKVYTDLRTKLTYRWGGSAYVIIASDLALGTTHQTAGFGDESRAAYNHSLVRGTGDVTAHNPHGLSKADIGLGDVPNVTTNNQTPTYTESQANEELTSGETLATAFGKLKKIVKSFIDHINTTLSTNPHNTTKSDVGLGNVTNVSTTDQITSGSTNNVTSGAVHTALAGKLGTNETAADSNYAHAIGTPLSHPAIGSSKLPVYVNASGEVTPISTLQVPTIEGNVEFTGNVTTQGDVEIDGGVEVKDDAIFRKDVAIVGNLSVSGVTTIAEQESAIASDYLITRLNNTQGLGQQGHSGIAVNNYQTNKMATMTVDGNGIWRLSASATKTSQTYTNISLFNDVYYDGLTHTTTTGPTHIITNAQSITAPDTVWYTDDSLYYHYNGSDWLPITSVTNGQFVYGSAVTDSGKIAALEALTKYTLLYYITVTDNAINESENQPLLTRDEHENITSNAILKWNDTNQRAEGTGWKEIVQCNGQVHSLTLASTADCNKSMDISRSYNPNTWGTYNWECPDRDRMVIGAANQMNGYGYKQVYGFANVACPMGDSTTILLGSANHQCVGTANGLALGVGVFNYFYNSQGSTAVYGLSNCNYGICSADLPAECAACAGISENSIYGINNKVCTAWSHVHGSGNILGGWASLNNTDPETHITTNQKLLGTTDVFGNSNYAHGVGVLMFGHNNCSCYALNTAIYGIGNFAWGCPDVGYKYNQFIFGISNCSCGYDTVAIGTSNTVKAPMSTALGRWNCVDTGAAGALVIGNGGYAYYHCGFTRSVIRAGGASTPNPGSTPANGYAARIWMVSGCGTLLDFYYAISHEDEPYGLKQANFMGHIRLALDAGVCAPMNAMNKYSGATYTIEQPDVIYFTDGAFSFNDNVEWFLSGTNVHDNYILRNVWDYRNCPVEAHITFVTS